MTGPVIAIAMKGYPRLSETFIAQELLGLQQRGLPFAIWSLRRPTDAARHLMHDQISVPVHYLPEYLHEEPGRVLRGVLGALARPGLLRLLPVLLRDLVRDRTRNRLRRFGQACVMARELPAATTHLHVHYLHTPASVIRYAALLRGIGWSFSAHAKDIWTTPDWEKREKIADAAWGVTCTQDGHRELKRLADRPDKVALVYHGLDLGRFPAPPPRPPRDGSDPADPVRIVTIGRAVEKKGFDDLLAALAQLPGGLHWRLTHIGGGEQLPVLTALAEELGISDKIVWMGSMDQRDVLTHYRQAGRCHRRAARGRSLRAAFEKGRGRRPRRAAQCGDGGCEPGPADRRDRFRRDSGVRARWCRGAAGAARRRRGPRAGAGGAGRRSCATRSIGAACP